jgi:hypothetical protein
LLSARIQLGLFRLGVAHRLVYGENHTRRLGGTGNCVALVGGRLPNLGLESVLCSGEELEFGGKHLWGV